MKPKPTLRSFLAALGSSILAISSASAADYYWDSNSTTGGFGSTNGTWGTSTFWSTDSLGESATANTTITTADTVYFGTDTLGYTGGRTVTVSGTQDVGNLIFGAASGSVTLQTGTLNLGAATPTITVNNATSTISAILTGSNGFTKAGSGILILNNNSNSYTGATVVTGGVLQVGTAFNTGNLSVPGGYTGNPVTGSNIELNGGILSYWFDFARTLGTGDGQIQLTGGVSGFTQKQGDRTGLVFGASGSEIQWGSATFNPSTLVLNDSAAVAAAPISFNNALDLNGANRTVATNSTALTGNTSAFGRVIETGALLNFNIRNTDVGNTAALIKTGAGKLALDGTNTYDGGTTINQGGVLFDNIVSMPATGTVTVNDGTELIVSVGNAGEWSTGTSGVGTLGGLFAGDGGQTAAQVTYGANVTIGVNVTTNQTYAGDLGNATGTTTTALSVYADDGSGQLTLNGNNSYTGATKLYDGATVVADSANALGSGGDITFATGGTLTYTAASAATDYGSRIKNSTSAIALNTNGQDITLSGIAAGNTGGLTKTGAGKLTFTGTNAFAGLTTLSGGSIEVTNGTVNGGGLSFGANNLTFSILGGSSSATWNAGNQNFGTVNSTRDNIQMVIDGDGVEGSAVLTNVNLFVWGFTHTNSTITLTDGGQINVNGETRIGNPYYSTAGGANMNIGGGTATSTFSGDGGDDFYIGYGERENSNNNVVTVSSGGVLTNIRDMVVGHVNNQQGNGLPSTANKLTVTGTGTASMRGLSVGYAQNAGIASDLEEANSNVVEVINGGTLTTSGAGVNYIGRAAAGFTESNANTMTVGGTGSSSWNAGNQNVFVGWTTNSSTATSNNNVLTIGTGGTVTNVAALTVGSGGGTETGNQLVVNGSLTATSVTVSNGNSLAGGGTINGAVTVNADGNVTPGSSVGTLNIVGSLNISAMAGGAGLLNYELDTLAASDRIDVTGTLDIGTDSLGLSDFNLSNLGGLQNGTYKLIETSQPITGTLAADTNGTLGSATIDLQLSGDGTDLELVVSGLGAGDPYDTWSGSLPFDGDANGDGVSNGLAFLLGAAGPNANALDLLPSVSESGGGLVMTFSMLDAASRGTATLAIEHSSDLGIADTWTTVAVPDSTGGPTGGVTFGVSGSGTLDVTATIGSGESALGKLFGRLKAVKP